MRLVAIAWLSLAGCGRIAFDPLADGGASGDIGDGDGAAAACAPFDTTLTIPSSLGGYPFPAVEWTGTEFLMVVTKGNAWAVMPVRPDGTAGTMVDNVIPGTELLGRGPSAIAWTGSQLGMLSAPSGGNGNILLRTIDPGSGAVTGPFIVNTSTTTWTGFALAWTGDRYIVAWSAGANVYMRELTASGAPMTPELLESTTAVDVQSIAVSPTRYVVGSLLNAVQACVVVVDRTSMAPATTMIDAVGGAGTDVVMRDDGAFAASRVSFMTGKLQLLGTTATPLGAGVDYPVSNANGLQAALQPTAMGYRLTTVTVTSPHAMQRVELDATGAAIGAATPIGSITTSSLSALTGLTGSDRSLLAVPYDSTTSSYQLRLIQTCD